MKIFISILFCSLNLWAQNSIVGQWKTIDDKTGKAKSVIEIYEKDGIYQGKIIKLFREPTEDQNPKCDKCSDVLKDKPILGMQNLNGLKKDSDTKWSGGEILDPNNGKTYSCKAELIEGGKKLSLRGFIGFSLIGRSQTWEREEIVAALEPALAPVAPPMGEASGNLQKSAIQETKKVPHKLKLKNIKK